MTGAAHEAGPVKRLVPDLDEELTSALNQIEELLLEVAGWEDEDPEVAWPPPRPAEQRWRQYNASRPRSRRRKASGAQAAGRTGRLVAPDGRYEHMPLRLADIDAADVAALAAAAAVFGDPRAPDHVQEALEHAAGLAYSTGDDKGRTRLVMTAAQLAGLLDLAPDRDTEILTALIEDAGPGDVILSSSGEAAYQRYATRANAMWSLGDSLARYLY